MTPSQQFEKCVKRSKDGKAITCRLGLWSVYNLDPEANEREARHYWGQYYADGEYDELLKEKTK